MARRKRNYKAEYARRVAKAEKAGKTRQAARGHKPKEHVERAERTKKRYGITPAQLTRLRGQARARVAEVFNKTAKNKVSERTISRGMQLLQPEDLRALMDMDEVDIRSAVSIRDAYLYQLGDYFPASIDDIEDAEVNPLWYHR